MHYKTGIVYDTVCHVHFANPTSHEFKGPMKIYRAA